jgi:hypothetical protein
MLSRPQLSAETAREVDQRYIGLRETVVDVQDW